MLSVKLILKNQIIKIMKLRTKKIIATYVIKMDTPLTHVSLILKGKIKIILEKTIIENKKEERLGNFIAIILKMNQILLILKKKIPMLDSLVILW